MPVKYDLLTNELAYQGLADLSVLVDDTSSDSPDYFRVSKLPKEFTAGKNTFHFKGNPNIFNEGSHVYIEILDVNGQSLYYETALDLESTEQTAIVTVYVKSTTPPGTAYIILCSTIRRDANGNFLDTSKINVRWTAPVYIDTFKRNDAEITFNSLPNVTIFPSTGSYTNLSYGYSNIRFDFDSYDEIDYYYYNNTAVITTSSLSLDPFRIDLINGNVQFISSNIVSSTPASSYSSNETKVLKASKFISPGLIELDQPLTFTVPNSNSTYLPTRARFSNISINFEVSSSGVANTTQNSYNIATAYFSNLTPIAGTIDKIRSYYRSAGVGEYIFSNETDITNLTSEFGFNVETVSASFFLPTIQRNDAFDFKFEFINPAGLISKQIVESLNNIFIGGNTYIGGDDNLLTGSLFVAGATGTGVQITGRNNASMIRSLGYTGFQNGLSGFVIYSGSVQSLLGAAEQYSGVGLELYANTSSYFKYTTSGSGLLDIRTNKFFIGNTTTFISASNNNLEILNYSGGKTKFHLDIAGNVTASAFIAITGSSDTTSQYMMNTAIGLTDGKNIGRIIYHQTDPITITSASNPIMDTTTLQHHLGSVTSAINSGSALQPLSEPYLNYQPIISDLSYYSLPFENIITIFGNVYVDKYSGSATSDNAPLVLALRFTVWSPVTSSYEYFGLSGNQDPLVGDDNYVAGVSGSLRTGKSSGLNSLGLGRTILPTAIPGDSAVAVPFKAVITIPSGSNDKINNIDLDYAFFKVYNVVPTVPGTDFTYRAKFANFTVMSSRALTSDAASGVGDIPIQYPGAQYPDIYTPY
jgi:hypothetical protein